MQRLVEMLEPAFEALAGGDRRGTVAAAVFDRMGSGRSIANVRAQAEWIQSTLESRVGVDDPHAAPTTADLFGRAAANSSCTPAGDR